MELRPAVICLCRRAAVAPTPTQCRVGWPSAAGGWVLPPPHHLRCKYPAVDHHVFDRCWSATGYAHPRCSWGGGTHPPVCCCSIGKQAGTSASLSAYGPFSYEGVLSMQGVGMAGRSEAGVGVQVGRTAGCIHAAVKELVQVLAVGHCPCGIGHSGIETGRCTYVYVSVSLLSSTPTQCGPCPQVGAAATQHPQQDTNFQAAVWRQHPPVNRCDGLHCVGSSP